MDFGRYCRRDGHTTATVKEKKPLNKTPVNKKSDGMKVLDKLYLKMRKPFLKENPICKANLSGCQTNAIEVHHKKGRGRYLLDVTTWLPTCRNCHRTITDNSKMAIEKGLSISKFKKDAA
jgi:hypothetical protein